MLKEIKLSNKEKDRLKKKKLVKSDKGITKDLATKLLKAISTMG